ncbi:MAG: hypothetical protein MAG794_00946 [Gammaproteobacteria bacterium]|nr:hypothetical protein [Gammaproteobacteria bacterium]
MLFRPFKPLLPALVAGLLAMPAMADDFTESVEMALDAYAAGDIKTAKEEIDFAAQILSQMKAEGLKAFLPQPFDGWEHKDDDDGDAMAAFGGGQMAKAVYRDGDDDVEIQLMADNQMVTALGTMFRNSALMASMGRVKRINHQKVVITNDGEIQNLVDGRIMIQISGSASVDVKEEYFKAIDIKALEEF